MAKITLKEYNEFLDNFEKQLKESIHLQEAAPDNKGIGAAKAGVLAHMRDLAKDGTGRFQNAASEVGLNPTGYERGDKEYQKTYNAGFNSELEKGLTTSFDPNSKTVSTQFNPEITQEIKDAAQRIRQYVNQNKFGATINWEAFKADPDYVYLMRMKDIIDRKGLTILYDDNAPLPSATSWGIKKGDTSGFDYGGVSVNKKGQVTGYDSIIDFWTSKVKNFVESKFGFDIQIPQKAFASGNDKLPDNTLIVNFTSALRCPAWNECLVKHACYARAGEKPHTNVLKANSNRYLLWELTRGDDEMMRLMINMVKAYMFNYELIYNEAAGMLRKAGIKNVNDLLSLDLDNELIDENLLEVFNKYKNVSNVRLNEDGDFIGQWLVDAWNKFGGQLKRFGIVISAYTCRNLNYEGVENIVLNSSNTANKNIDRYFIAISEEAYSAFDDTHEGFDPETGRLKTVLKPLGTFDESGKWTPNGNMYYKCPCGNEDIMGPKKKKELKTSLMDYDCYKCNTCYTPNELNNGQPYYVFVKVHGSSESALKERDGGSFRFGFSEHFRENAGNAGVPEAPLQEDVQISNGTNLALVQVTNNMVTSMNNRFSSYNPSLEEAQVKNKFKHLLERINNTKF